MSHVQDELTISDTSDKIAEPRLDARVVDPENVRRPFSCRDETTGLLIFTGIAYFIADIAVRQILRGPAGEAGVLFSMAVVGSQWILLSIWLGLGNWALPFRMLLSIAVVAAGLLVVIDDASPPDFWTAVWVGSLLLIATSLPFGLVTLFGLRLVHEDSLSDQPRRPPAIQFSVRNLLSWTASAGIVAAIVRAAPAFDFRAIEPVLILVGATAALGGTSLWAAMSHHPTWPRAFAPLAVSLFISLLFTLSDAPSSFKLGMLISTMLLSLAVMLILRLFRRLGWRITFRPTMKEP